MSVVNRAAVVDGNFTRLVSEWSSPLPPPRDRDLPVLDGGRLTGHRWIELFASQIESRHLDYEARNLKSKNKGYYTIGSTGHEANAAVAAALRPNDPAFLHYRSGAFFRERARQVPGVDSSRDVLLGMVASSDDPISGGRHKVFGSKPMWIPPQTSTIASHLPKAVGAALALERANALGLQLPVPNDAIMVCTFGDASANHNVAAGAVNTALWAWHKGDAVPVLFVCEDNGIGISVPTPGGWVEAAYGDREGLAYVAADGRDLAEVFEAATDAVAWCREKRQPVFLHISTVRMLGHAGSDVETEYRTREEIEAVESLDPLLESARFAISTGLMTPTEVSDLYESTRRRIAALGAEVVTRPVLTSAEEVVAPLAPYSPERVAAEATRSPAPEVRGATFGGDERLPEKQKPRHLAVLLNQALHDTLLKYPEAFLFGEDVAKKGGVYHVTDGLWDTYGDRRVFNTLLDETSILGLAIGAAHLDLLPLPEIQYLAYYHNAEDQIRGEAASLQFFSKGQFRNGMVVRIAALGYQKGFGGHFHNDNSIAALRDVPGVVIAAPSRGDDAVGMLRTALALAKVDGRVVLWLEPIALYMTKDLHEDNDGGWLCRYPDPGVAVPFGKARVWPCEGKADLSIVTFGNGTWLSLRAARILERDHGIRARVTDLRWLNPLDVDTLKAEAEATGRVLVVDEGRKTGGLSEAIFTAIVEACPRPPKMARDVGADTYIPLGNAWKYCLPSEASIVEKARALVRG